MNNSRELSNSELMRSARESLSGKWGLAIGTIVLYWIVSAVAGFIPFASLIVGGPLMLGISIFSLAISRNEEAKVDQIFEGFNNFGNAFLTYLLMVLFILLWCLLLIIPGIIKALAYSMSFYILAENPDMRAQDILNRSQEMMNGYKGKLFLLFLAFAGLSILCVLTLGIGFFWLAPFMQITLAKFYDDVKSRSPYASDQGVWGELNQIGTE